MGFVRIIFYFIVLTVCASCQIIEFPEDKTRRDVENDANEMSETAEVYETNIYNNTSDVPQPDILVDFRPTEGFEQDVSLELQKEFQFTNYDTRNLTNPFYTVFQFLEAVTNRDFKILQAVTSSEFPYFKSIRPEDSQMFWCYMRGITGLYKGIGSLRRVDDSLHFKLLSVSDNVYKSIVVKAYDNVWRVSNILTIVNVESIPTKRIKKYDTGKLVWRGIWEIKTIETYDFTMNEAKLTKFSLLKKIFADARDNLDIGTSTSFLSSEIAEKFLPEFMLSKSLEYDSRLKENIFMINFYKSYDLTKLIEVATFPISENLQIETYAAVFDVKINPIVFFSWLVIDGVSYIERIELPTGSSQQILFRN